MSKIEQIIDEIETFIDGCKFQALSNNTRIIVDKEQMEELLRELRRATPEEIMRYQKIISNKEAILNDAKEKANALISEAQVHTDQMVEEHEIMQQAYAQANEIVQQAYDQAQQMIDQATEEANGIRQSVMEYTDDRLADLQSIVNHAIDTAQAKYGDLLTQLKECGDVINKNRDELKPKNDPVANGEMPPSPDVLI